jgi:hypothetical protein
MNGRTPMRVSMNKRLRRIFGANKKKVIKGCRTLHWSKKNLHNLYSSVNLIRIIKSRDGRGTWSTRERSEMHTKVCSENLKGIQYLGLLRGQY